MKLLLDTQAFLWWMSNSPRLSRGAEEAVSDPGNQVLFSVASAWEISIKRALGKLKAPEDLASAIDAEGFDLLGIELSHIEVLDHLEHHHRDPFDRMLIAQSLIERATLVTSDPVFQRYDTAILW